MRSLLLQQDAEVFSRFDIYWESLPNIIMLLLSRADKEGFVEWLQGRFELCCGDAYFLRDIFRSPEGKRYLTSEMFLSALWFLDKDDSVCTVVENERQHGSLRIGYGVKLQQLVRQVGRQYLKELMQEHRGRGLGHDRDKPLVHERIRQTVQFHREVERAKHKSRKRMCDPRVAYASHRDSLDKRSADAPRTRQ